MKSISASDSSLMYLKHCSIISRIYFKKTVCDKSWKKQVTQFNIISHTEGKIT